MTNEIVKTSTFKALPSRVFKRGDIYYIDKFPVVGSEQRPGRPAVIVSNNSYNFGMTVEIVYLTGQTKPSKLCYMVLPSGDCHDSTLIGNQVTTVDTRRIGDYAGNIFNNVNTVGSMKQLVGEMLVDSLDLWDVVNALVEKRVTSNLHPALPQQINIEATPSTNNFEVQLAQKETEIYKDLYEKLLAKTIRKTRVTKNAEV